MVLKCLVFVVLFFLMFGIVGWKYVDWYIQERDYMYEWDYFIENESGLVLQCYKKDGKICGVYYFGSCRFNGDIFIFIIKNNIEWVVFVFYSYQEDYDSFDLCVL